MDASRSRSLRILICWFVVFLAWSLGVHAQDGASAEDLRKLVARQGAMLEAQQKQIREQQRRLDQQAQALKAVETRLEQMAQRQQSQSGDLDEALASQREDAAAQSDTLLAMQNQIDRLETDSGRSVTEADIELRERLERLEHVLSDEPENPEEDLSASDFPGSFPIPGSNAAVKLGGYVRGAGVRSYDGIGSDDRFVTASIPVSGEDSGGIENRASLSAQQSRLNIDLRQDTGVGAFRAFVEGDFAEQDDTFRLRHSYGQFRSLVLGQTWSTMVDNVAVPEELDFEGLNARIQVRKALGSYAFRVGETWRLVAALEDPEASVQGGNAVVRVPDLILSGRRTVGSGFLRGHNQVSLLLRQVRAEPDSTPGGTESAFGWGVSASRKIQAGFTERDSLTFQITLGDGIGNYINDLRAAGGQDGAIDPVSGDLETLEVAAGYGSFQHWWNEKMRSTFVYGLVQVDNRGAQPGDAYKRTQRAVANFIWSPLPRIDVGGELLWGERKTKDNRTGDALQTQIVVKYKF